MKPNTTELSADTLRAVWNEKSNQFDYFSSADLSADRSVQEEQLPQAKLADLGSYPPDLGVMLMSIAAGGGLRRPSLAKLCLFGGLTSLVTAVGAFCLNLTGHIVLAGLLLVSGPFAVFLFVIWASLKANRLNRVLAHLDKHEKEYHDRAKRCGRTFSALFVKGESQEIEGYVEFGRQSQPRLHRDFTIKVITHDVPGSTKDGDRRLDLDESKQDFLNRFAAVDIEKERAETLQNPVFYDPPPRKNRILSEWEPSSQKRMIKIPTHNVLVSSSRKEFSKMLTPHGSEAGLSQTGYPKRQRSRPELSIDDHIAVADLEDHS